MFEHFEPYIGYAAGISTSLLWTATSLLFTAAVARLGPTQVNTARMVLAVLLLGATLRLRFGVWIPPAVSEQVWYLGVSGIVGLTVGDQALLTALVDIGPRRAVLLMTTAPLMAALVGHVALDEHLTLVAWAGIVTTVAGVCWVVLERPAVTQAGRSPVRLRGVVLALLAAACQAGGLMLSKKGMGHGWLPADRHLDPQAAALVRMTFGAAGMLPILIVHALRERGPKALNGRSRPRRTAMSGYLFAAGGAVVGPYLGVWMSLVATDRAPIGVAQTLASLTPIFILPFMVWIYHERISWRASVGAVAAVGGCVLLFLSPR